MRFTLTLALICAYAVSIIRGDDASSDVVTLTDDSFDQFVKSNKYVLAEFYAPWCGHCKALAPEYEKAASQLKEAGSEVKLAKVDATVQKEIAGKLGVQGYPTLFWFINGEKADYKGGRTADTIISWINKRTGPSVSTGRVPEAAGQPVVVLKSKSITAAFQAVAESLADEAVFHHVESDAEVVTLQHKGEEPIVASAEDMKDIKAFVQNNALSKFGALDGETYGKYMSSGKGLVWVLLKIESSADLAGAVNAHRPAFLNLAAKFPNYNFAYIDTVAFKAAVENMLGVSSFPAIAVNLKAGDKKKFIFSGELTESAVGSFLGDVETGKIEPTLKSEEIPESNEEPVRVVVGRNLKEEVFHATKDVLFEVYAPWCGHCKKLAPEYEKVAQKVRREGLEDLITIAKMDGTTNDSPVDSISWEGFPTLFYVKAGTNEPIPFTGGRDAKSIWKWITSNHSQSDLVKQRIADAKAARSSEPDEAKEEL
jgi:protein disulfide isomerase